MQTIDLHITRPLMVRHAAKAVFVYLVGFRQDITDVQRAAQNRSSIPCRLAGQDTLRPSKNMR